jgi:putative acetyltransferase
VQVRPERPEDHSGVATLHSRAFGDQGAAVVRLVDDLRRSLATEPGLSLVAVDDETVVGHVLFTCNLLDAPQRIVDVQVLSPAGVLPERQRTGIGSTLIRAALEELDQRQVPLVFLEGSPVYYSRFGFRPAGALQFRRPSLRIPEAGFQVRLLAAYEEWMTGTLVYRPEFWSHDLVGLRDDPPR